MANFGYSIGDFILLLDLSRRVIKSYQDAPKQFQDISTEVKGLNTVLNRTKEVIDHATESFGTDLRHLAEGCHEVLNDANTLLEQFQGCFPKPADATPLSALTRLTESSDTGLLGKFLRIKNKSKKVRGRFRWDESAVGALRMRIMVNTTLMMAYNTCVQSATPADIENSVKVAITDLQPMLAPRAEPYISNLALRMMQSGGSTFTVDSLETVKSETLREITAASGDTAAVEVGEEEEEKEDVVELVTASNPIASPSSAITETSGDRPSDEDDTVTANNPIASLSSAITETSGDSPSDEDDTVTGNNPIASLSSGITETSGDRPSDEDDPVTASNPTEPPLPTNDPTEPPPPASHPAQPPTSDLPRIYSGDDLLPAIRSSSLPEVRAILATGVSANSLSPGALILTARGGDPELVRCLLDHGANPNTQSPVDGNTVLISAASSGIAEVVQLFLDAGADVNTPDAKLWTALHHAANSGHLPVVRLLLRRQDIVFDAPAKSGDTPLLRAAWRGHEEIVSLLMDKGADINFVMNPRNETALIRAAACGEEAVVRLLLHHGADVNAVDERHATALLHAADTGNAVIAGLLLDHRADMEIQTFYEKDTPLIKAAWRGNEGVVRLLLDHGADITKKNRHGMTAREFMNGDLGNQIAWGLGNLVRMHFRGT